MLRGPRQGQLQCVIVNVWLGSGRARMAGSLSIGATLRRSHTVVDQFCCLPRGCGDSWPLFKKDCKEFQQTLGTHFSVFPAKDDSRLSLGGFSDRFWMPLVTFGRRLLPCGALLEIFTFHIVDRRILDPSRSETHKYCCRSCYHTSGNVILRTLNTTSQKTLQ